MRTPEYVSHVFSNTPLIKSKIQLCSLMNYLHVYNKNLHGDTPFLYESKSRLWNDKELVSFQSEVSISSDERLFDQPWWWVLVSVKETRHDKSMRRSWKLRERLNYGNAVRVVKSLFDSNVHDNFRDCVEKCKVAHFGLHFCGLIRYARI